MSFSLNKFAVTALTLAVCAAGSQSIAADTVHTKMVSFDPNYLMVVGNGTKYTKLKTNGTLRIRGHFFYDTGINGRIKSWKFWPGISYTIYTTNFLPGTEAFAKSQSYPNKNTRPTTVNQPVPMDVPTSFIAAAAVSACNKTAADMRGAGASNAVIFSQDRDASLEFWPRYDVELTGTKSKLNIDGMDRKSLPIRCLKHSGPAIPQIGTIRPSDPATPWIQAPAGTQPEPVPDTRRPKRLLKIGG